MRLVCACTRRTSASCASVVTPGLSTMKSLPACMTRMPSGARSFGNSRADHQLDGLVVEDLLLGAGDLGLRVPLGECRDEFRLLGVDGRQRAAVGEHRLDLAVDVAMVEPDRGKGDGRSRRRRRLPACRRLGRGWLRPARAGSKAGIGQAARAAPERAEAVDERASIHWDPLGRRCRAGLVTRAGRPAGLTGTARRPCRTTACCAHTIGRRRPEVKQFLRPARDPPGSHQACLLE